MKAAAVEGHALDVTCVTIKARGTDVAGYTVVHSGKRRDGQRTKRYLP